MPLTLAGLVTRPELRLAVATGGLADRPAPVLRAGYHRPPPRPPRRSPAAQLAVATLRLLTVLVGLATREETSWSAS